MASGSGSWTYYKDSGWSPATTYVSDGEVLNQETDEDNDGVINWNHVMDTTEYDVMSRNHVIDTTEDDVMSRNHAMDTTEDDAMSRILQTIPLEVLRSYPSLRTIYDRGIVHGMMSRNSILTSVAYMKPPIEVVRAAEVLMSLDGAIGSAVKGLMAAKLSVTLADESSERNAVESMVSIALDHVKNTRKAIRRARSMIRKNDRSSSDPNPPLSGHGPADATLLRSDVQYYTS